MGTWGDPRAPGKTLPCGEAAAGAAHYLHFSTLREFTGAPRPLSLQLKQGVNLSPLALLGRAVVS